MCKRRPPAAKLNVSAPWRSGASTELVLRNVSQRFSLFLVDHIGACNGFPVPRKEPMEAGGDVERVSAVASLCKQTSSSFIKVSPDWWEKMRQHKSPPTIHLYRRAALRGGGTARRGCRWPAAYPPPPPVSAAPSSGGRQDHASPDLPLPDT